MGERRNQYLNQIPFDTREVCYRVECVTKALLTDGCDMTGGDVGVGRPCIFCGAMSTPEEEVYQYDK